MATAKFAVNVGYQGDRPTIVMVGSGATVRSALKAAKIDADAVSGGVTINGEGAELGDRLAKNDFIVVTPKVSGGK